MLYPFEKDVKAFYGEPGDRSKLTKVELPYPMLLAWDTSITIKRFTCHQYVRKPLLNIFTRTLNHYGIEDVKRLGLDLFGGCHNIRSKRGSDKVSMHAYGIAVDINPVENRYLWKSDKARFSKKEYDCFWRIVEGEGAISLGRLYNIDWMHFQFTRGT